MCVCSFETESRSVVSDSLGPHELYNLCNSPGPNTGVGSLSLFQGIFLTQESNRCLLHCRWILYQLGYEGNPFTPAHFSPPPPFLVGNHKVLGYVLRPFLFGKEVHLYPFLDSISKWYHVIIALLPLTSLFMILSTSLLLDMASCHPLYGWVMLPCVCTWSSVSIHLSFSD